MLSLTACMHRLHGFASGQLRGFASDRRGSISILSATFIALLLGMGTAAIKVGDAYAGRLRDLRSADIVAHALLASTLNATSTRAPAAPGGGSDGLGSLNGSHLGIPKIFVRDGHTVFLFPCGIEIVI